MFKKIYRKKLLIYYSIIGISALTIVSCSSIKKIFSSSRDLQTKSLFMQSKQVNIELPPNSNKGGAISESVTIKNADNWFDKKADGDKVKEKTSINDVQHLDEVVVTTRLKLTPEHEGKVAVDFVVKVPKELMSPLWRVTLKPTLLHNDSIVPLQDIILKGSDFFAMQKQDYQTYDDYLKSIVDSAKYDSVFLDRKGIDLDIKNIQGFHYNEYYKYWDRQKTFEDDLALWTEKYKFFNDRQVAYKKEMYHIYSRKALEETIKKYSQGKDTTGIYAHHMNLYEKKTEGLLSHWQEKVSDLDKNKPQNELRFKSLSDVSNNTFTKEDSLKVTKHHYLFRDIAYNEIKSERREDFRKETIKYPYEENTRIDSLADVNRDFTYLYKQSYPVTPGLKKLRIVMNGKVDATDQSSYTMNPSDTLSYFITSLSDLADTTFMYKVTKLNRDVFNRVMSYVKFPAKGSTFNINYRDNKVQMDKILNAYESFDKAGVYSFDSIFIKVSTSLDGPYDDNIILSEKRSIAIKNYIKSVIGNRINVDTVFRTEHTSEDWNTLVREIQRRKEIQHKDEILNLLTTAKFPDSTEDEIKRTYKADFAIIRDSIYPLLNRAEVTFNMHRTDMTESSEVRREFREGYDEGIRLLQEREYWKAMEILAKYPDYNAALCLTCLGYNAKAYELLQSLEKTGGTEYLLAILSERLNKTDEVVEHLMESFKLDPTKIYRAPLDSEVAKIIEKYNIQSRIDALLAAPIPVEE